MRYKQRLCLPFNTNKFVSFNHIYKNNFFKNVNNRPHLKGFQCKQCRINTMNLSEGNLSSEKQTRLERKTTEG